MNRLIFPRGAAVLLVGLALCSPLLNGCGGSGHGGALSTTASGPASAHAAQATVTIKWPARPIVTGIAPRLIPLASNSVTVTITQGTHIVATHLFIRPGADQPLTATFTFGSSAIAGFLGTDALPVGSLIATAKAFPSVDGKGTAQSGGSRDFVTTLGANAPININMGTTIVNLVITPSSPTVAVGVTTQMTATAVDATGAMVLTTASKVQWSSSAPAIASVDPNTGMVTSIALGNAILTATDGETGQSGSTNILVKDGNGTGGSTATYTVTDLGTLPGGVESVANALNSAGQVVGASSVSGGISHAFLYSNGQMQDLGTLPNREHSTAAGINDAGQVVGDSTGDNFSHAFLYSKGHMQDLGTFPGYDASYARSINSNGQVVGNCSSGTSGHAFSYIDGQMKDIGTLPSDSSSVAEGVNSAGQIVGSSFSANFPHAFLYSNGQIMGLGAAHGDYNSQAIGINTAGQVVGYSYNFDTTVAFLYSDGKMQDLGELPSDIGSQANGINSTGQIVGCSYYYHSSGNEVQHAFVYSNNQMQELQTLIPPSSGWSLEIANGINDNGQICGNGTINGQSHAFLLTPVGLTPQRRH